MKYPSILIVDLDGTVRVNLAADCDDRSTFGFINEPHDQKILPQAANAIAKYKSQGWTIVAATNQAGVASGYKTLDECIQEQQYTLQLLGDAVDGIYFCPDYEGMQCFYVHHEGCDKMIDAYLSDGQWKYSVTTGLYVQDDRIIGLCRKPNGGMLTLASQRIRADTVHFVGDREEDRLAAINANLPQENFFWAKDWWLPC
jgi:D-glycero-D-manno-heptose 1,7-bisphosphate phosphatase